MPEERKLIRAIFADDQVTIKSFVSMAALRNRFLIIAACHGDIALLKAFRCKFDDLERIALIQYSAYAKHRQAVLDYFWSLVNQPYRGFRPVTDETLPHWAAMLNQVDYLKDHAKYAYHENTNGVTPLMCAEYYEHVECIELLIAQKDAHKEKKRHIDSISMRLTLALIHIDINDVLNLLAHGADPNYQYNRTTPLSIVSARVDMDLPLLLLAHGADPNIKSGVSITPLVSAVFHRSFNNIRLLLIYGADPDLKSVGDMTALMIAVRERRIGALELLLTFDANPFLKNNKGETALDVGDGFISIPLLVAMYLKSEPANKSGILNGLFSFFTHGAYLRKAYGYNSDEFNTRIKNIIDHNIWPWVTKEMKQRLLADRTVQTSLGLVGEAEKETSDARYSA